MSKIWTYMIIIAIIFSIIIGKPDEVIEYITNGAKNSVENVLTLAGMLCFWSGIFNIVKNTNLICKFSNVVKPIINRLLKKDEIDEDITQDIALNITSNFLGVGNVATMFGIRAIQKMQKLNKNKDKPNDSMACFVLLNTASIQLIPTTMISLRIMYGSNNPSEIILPVIIVSIISLTLGIFAIKILNRVVK